MSRKKQVERLDFDTIFLQTIPVTIGGAAYTLREVSAQIFAQYRSALFLGSVHGKNEDGTPEFKFDRLPELDIYLLSLCLTEDATGHNVLEEQIKGWPNRVTDTLITTLKEMSGIETGAPTKAEQEDRDETVKNSPDAGTDGSA